MDETGRSEKPSCGSQGRAKKTGCEPETKRHDLRANIRLGWRVHQLTFHAQNLYFYLISLLLQQNDRVIGRIAYHHLRDVYFMFLHMDYLEWVSWLAFAFIQQDKPLNPVFIDHRRANAQ
ncbi:MAG: hypothetical protein P8163_12255 [Candidatus Thiodiazotropha sp.]